MLSNVNEPFGVVVLAPLSVEARLGTFVREEDIEPLEAFVEAVGEGTRSVDSDNDLRLRESGPCGQDTVTVFRPMPRSLLAGMNSVVRPSLLAIEVVAGCFADEQLLSLSFVAVE